jgi:hypothetical protein
MFKTLKNLTRIIPFLRRKKEENLPDIIPSKLIRKIDFEKFQNAIHYKILNREFFVTALTHRSFIKIRKDAMKPGLVS